MSTNCIICNNYPGSVEYPYQREEGIYCWRCFLNEIEGRIDEAPSYENQENMMFLIKYTRKLEEKMEKMEEIANEISNIVDSIRQK